MKKNYNEIVMRKIIIFLVLFSLNSNIVFAAQDWNSSRSNKTSKTTIAEEKKVDFKTELGQQKLNQLLNKYQGLKIDEISVGEKYILGQYEKYRKLGYSPEEAYQKTDAILADSKKNQKGIREGGRTVGASDVGEIIKTKKDNQRTGRNPQTGKEIKIKEGIAIKEEGAPIPEDKKNHPAYQCASCRTGENDSVEEGTLMGDFNKEVNNQKTGPAGPIGPMGGRPQVEMAEKKKDKLIINFGGKNIELQKAKPGDPVPGIDITVSVPPPSGPKPSERVAAQDASNLVKEVLCGRECGAEVKEVVNEIKEKKWEKVEIFQKDEKSKPVVTAKRKVKKKLFWLFEVEYEEKLTVQENKKEVEKPWWSFLAW